MMKTKWLKIFNARGGVHLFNTHKIIEILYSDGRSDSDRDASYIGINCGDVPTSDLFYYLLDDTDNQRFYEDSVINILAIEALR